MANNYKNSKVDLKQYNNHVVYMPCKYNSYSKIYPSIR